MELKLEKACFAPGITCYGIPFITLPYLSYPNTRSHFTRPVQKLHGLRISIDSTLEIKKFREDDHHA